MRARKELYASPDKYVGKSVTVCGWVRTFRDSSQIAFLELADGTCFSESDRDILLKAEGEMPHAHSGAAIFNGLNRFSTIWALAQVALHFLTRRDPDVMHDYGKMRGFKQFLLTAELDRIKLLFDENPDYFSDIIP